MNRPRPLVPAPPPILFLMWPLLAGCVAYESADLDVRTLATATTATPPLPIGSLSFVDAVALALRHNPVLQRHAADARAAGADVPATEIEAAWEGADEMLSLAVDPVALLGLGPRGAAIDAAKAREAAAIHELAVARWRLIGNLAEVYAAIAAIDAITPTHFDHDPEPFVRAGLASPTAAAMARGAARAAAAERAMLAAEREALLGELRTDLGVVATAAVEPAALPDALLPPPGDDADVLRRPDLALAVAQYRVADAEFRAAVADQWPSLMLGPDIPLRGGALDAMARLRLPLGAASRATAAKARRDAARAGAATALIAADNEVHTMRQQALASAARAAATTQMTTASAAALAAAEVALAVEPDAFEPLVERAQQALRDAMEHRQAVVVAARARVRAAVAAGWPAMEVAP